MDYTIEQVIADYLDTDYIRVAPTKLYRYNARNGRYYFTRDEDNKIQFYQSVTTIIDRNLKKETALVNWMRDTPDYSEQMTSKAAYGTILHILFKDLLLGKDIPLSDSFFAEAIGVYLLKNNIKCNTDYWDKDLRQDLIGITRWIQDYKIVPLAIEISLTHHDGFAGCIDLVCKTKDGNMIVDLKSNRNAFYTSNIVQLEAYRELWNYNYPDVKIDGLYNLGMKDYRYPIGKSVTPYRFENQSDKPELEYWRHLLMMAKITGALDKPKNYYDVEQTILTKDTDVTTLIYEVDVEKKIAESEEKK